MNLDLTGKNAFIGGSSRGIGKAIAVELAELGAEITLVSRSENQLKEGVQELATRKGQKHDYIVADFSQPDQLKAEVESYLADSGKSIHILVNNTGGPPGGPIAEAKLEEFEQAFANHLICNQLLAQAFLPGMKQAGFGRIINVISTSVRQPLKGLGVSNTVRGAVANWAKTWSFEVGQFGITVNNVLPGATATERLSSIIENKAKKTGQSEAEVEKTMKGQIPAGRFADPSEVAAAAAFLASPAAGYINGINIPVDGGRLTTY
jgi:3-oxoacyl-[acyl-carrier protein] reductase